MIRILFEFVIVFLASLVLTGIIRSYVLAKNILDIPNNRSSHKIPTPRGGGLSIALLFSFVTTWLVFIGSIKLSLFYALNGGILIAAIGWIDDLVSVGPVCRSVVQGIAAMWAIYWLRGMPSLMQGVFGYLIGVVSIIWCVNLYNFMDGIDGLSGAEGIFISISAGIILSLIGSAGIGLLCFLLAASIAGFLVWNWPPAKIFMGDVGSGYLGYVFCVLAIATANAKVLPLIFWCIISAIFLCDATFTVIKRKIEGKRWYEAHREHAYQCLSKFGLTHANITTSVVVFNVFILFPAACVTFFYPKWSALIIIIGMVSFFLLWVSIVKSRVLSEIV